MLPRVVSETALARVLNALGGAQTWRRTYAETAAGIARAATDDPLLPDVAEGAELTACLLVAAAWEASRLHPYAPGPRGMGLYRIPTPPVSLRPNLLVLPRSASLVAIDLMRTSFVACVEMPWNERLAWYYDVGTTHRAPSEIAKARSVRVMHHAKKLFVRYYSLETREVETDSDRPLLGEPHVLEHAS